MSTGTCIDKNPLQHDGTSRQQRMPELLYPDSIELHAFTGKDWMRFAYEYAKQVNYFGHDNDTLPEADWRDFFVKEEAIDAFLAGAEKEQRTEPHLALFLAFLKLMAFPRQQMNALTGRHLDFYYKEVLQLRKKTFTPDSVFVVFELAKNVATQHLPAGTLLDAGKDKSKRSLQYELTTDMVVNTAVAGSFKSILHDAGKAIRYADIADSLDGLGAPLPAASPAWFAMGHKKVDGYPDLPVARLGFALASGVLHLQEGTRNIQVTLSLEVPASFNVAVFNGMPERITALLTGAKGWIGAAVTEATVTKNGTTASLRLALMLDAKEEAVTGYTPALHQERYTTDLPIVRILFEAVADSAYADYAELLKARVLQAQIDVEVKGYKGFTAENDNGVLDPSKPFLPFGVLPRKNASFYVGSPEIFQKNWEDISLHIEWKDKPASLKDHYMAYKNRFLTEALSRQNYDLVYENSGGKLKLKNNDDHAVTGDDYFTVDIAYVKNGKWSQAQNRELFAEPPLVLNSTPQLQAVYMQPPVLFQTGYNANKFLIQQYYAGSYAPYSILTFNPGFAKGSASGNASFSGNVKDNFLKITLVEDFLHQHYARLYSVAMSMEGGVAVIPKEPYTPLIASLSLDYSARSNASFVFTGSGNTPAARLSSYTSRNIQLFHEMPFGQSEQHVFLREQSYPAAEAARIGLLPVYESEGQLLIGLSDARPGTIVSLLFQVNEGSENPSAPSFSDTVRIEWHGLGNNEWKALGSEAIIADSTNNFLRPGIISFLLPERMNDSNTILPSGQLWLKAQLPPGTRFDSICRFTGIKAQASQALFHNDANELSHLAGGLPPGTISRLGNRAGGIKKITQPYVSFDGAPEESDHDFYLRVSERLRHKNRGVAIWDYERLILARFPGIFKVKCLNHTSSEASHHPGYEIDPGYVTVVPVPDVRNKNLYNVLQPKVSSNRLREIEDYLKEICCMHIRLAAAHPEYEEVCFRFKVKFHKQYDPAAYVGILNEALKALLAPWAYDQPGQIRFGGTLYKSAVIGFIENQPYVDFVTDFKMLHDGTDHPAIQAASSRSILTTAPKHEITPVIGDLPC